MSEPTLLSSVFWNWGTGIVTHAKFITSAVVGILGTAVTVQRNLSEISEGRSTPARKLENKKVAELLGILAKVPPGDSFSACRKELELQLAQSLSELEALRAKESKLAEGPNHGLTLMQRVVFGGLAFRAWALAERKWAMESLKRANGSDQRMQSESGPFQALFVLRKSRGWRMLVAQICMWTCLFCAMESLEDIFLSALDASMVATQVEQAGKATLANTSSPEPKREPTEVPNAAKEAREAAKSGLLLLLTSLLGAVICRAWAAVEWLHGSPSPHPTFAKAIFPVLKLGTSKAWLLTTSYVAALAMLITSVLTWSLIFKDPLDRAEFAFVSLAACIACNRLLSFLGYVTDNSKENKSAALAQSASV